MIHATMDTTRLNAIEKSIKGWKSLLSGLTSGLIFYGLLSGLAIYALPFSQYNQFNVLIHTILGLISLVPIGVYCWKHWKTRTGGTLNHYQLLGYSAIVFLVICLITGIVLTGQSLFSNRISSLQSTIHLLSAIIVGLFFALHILTIALRKMKQGKIKTQIKSAQKIFNLWVLSVTFLSVLWGFIGWANYQIPEKFQFFDSQYNWRFGQDKPFQPSLAVLDINDSDQSGHQKNHPLKAANPKYLSRSKSCGSSNCHENIYKEWLPSAHRYSSMDDMFQKVQTIMMTETSPEHTRYCAGCHDPISLLSGAKNSTNVTLGVEGYDEGSSCVVCHSIVKTDVQGNGNYVIHIPDRYLYELNDDPISKLVSDFLIRSYPKHHVQSYSKPLYKTEEFCAACHKQYIDKQVNTDIGKVQGQNQYDSWKNSRWYHKNDPKKSISCRECHMPLQNTADPANGDSSDYYRSPTDNKHRSHRTLATNSYIPQLMKLDGAKKHIQLTESWLQGRIDIPEIADKWVKGPVVSLQVIAPQSITEGERVSVAIAMLNNKAGHDFPTGPLDMIESWVELIVTDQNHKVVFHQGGLDDQNRVDKGATFRADGFDRKGALIDRHNLWDLVGANYKRTLFPGRKDLLQMQFQCPSMARGRVIANQKGEAIGERKDLIQFDTANLQQGINKLHIVAKLWYRKANPEFLNAVYGIGHSKVIPAIMMTEAEQDIQVLHAQ
ncbi:MAG: hypothetical protein COW84_02505 [Gammaproteobacteria bacterium CG22_combo_CG10-13_8_21_14_all_40_8]|nr:MAG: hypothetical protein COW84_02505 [Gammaproteobacteria bacterium CG22_combo_CG10-13_8_21_14_all_40_8]